MDIPAQLANLDAQVIFFPVRHHSPKAARLVRELIHDIQPDAVLIEGPADYMPQFDELYLGHQLPIAIYSYVRLLTGQRLGAFYPFSIYSPEWQAILAGNNIGADVQFIDMPWAELATMEQEPVTHRYADGHLEQSGYVAELCDEVGVENFDTLWDKLFEVDAGMTVQGYLDRAHIFMYHLRETAHFVRQSDIAREAFMMARIRESLDNHNGRILVVTGGFHSSALYERLHDDPRDDEQAYEAVDLDRGIALTPYSYGRLDNLTGYESGMPNPGFYHQVWVDDEAKATNTHRKLLAQTAIMLRERKQSVTPADLIAVDTTAHALASLRGHQRVWRRDLIDGIISALVKDELAYDFSHPFLDAIHELFRGNLIGRLAEGTAVPPLSAQINELLENYELTPKPTAREVSLELTKQQHLECSRILHQLRVLGVPGFRQTGQRQADSDETQETWRIHWQPEFDAAVIERTIYGATLVDAARARLHENLGDIEAPTATDAAKILMDMAQMGMPDSHNFYRGLAEVIGNDQSFFTVTAALDKLLFLYRFDRVLGTSKHTDIGQLLSDTFSHGVWLLQTLGVVQDRDKELLSGLRALQETYERCSEILKIGRDEFVDTFMTVSHDNTQTPVMRGAVSGVLLLLNEANEEAILMDMRYFSQPEQLGDFLTGLFFIAREPMQRHPEMIARIDELLCGYGDEDFLIAVPSLRLAFSFFTPREKHHIAFRLFEDTEVSPYQALQVDYGATVKVLEFETELFKQLEYYGLWGDA